MRKLRYRKIIVSALLLPLSFLSGLIQAEVTDADLAGMKLANETKQVKIYIKSGVALSQYKSLYLNSLDANFDADWLRDYNRERKSLTYRLNKKDVAQITGRYVKKFKQILGKTLKSNEGPAMADSLDAADLKVESSIVNLRLNAPDKATASWTTNLVRQAGEAELHTKMYDAKTGQLVIAIIDKKETRENVDLYQTNRVRNQSEFIPVYRAWAKNWLIALEQKS